MCLKASEWKNCFKEDKSQYKREAVAERMGKLWESMNINVYTMQLEWKWNVDKTEPNITVYTSALQLL